jgi:hypothetical protein
MIRTRMRLYRSCWLTLAIGMLTMAGCSGSAAIPTSYAKYNSPGGTFACDYPEGWQAEGGGKRGLEWAKFTSGPAEIRMEAGAAGSLVGDIAKNLGGQEGELGPESEPVHSVHLAVIDSAEGEFDGYKEVGDAEVIEVGLGPARRSEFTASSTFGSGVHGYRATALGSDKAVYVYCTCPESNWATVQPVFDKVLLSLVRGRAE